MVAFFVFLLTILVSFVLLFLVLFLIPRLYDSGKASPLERGFFSFSGGRGMFRLQFFTLLIIYMVFDLEIVLFRFFVFTRMRGWAFLLVVAFAVLTLLVEWFFGKLV